MAKRDWLRTGKGAVEVGVGIATGNPMLAMRGGSDIAGGLNKNSGGKGAGIQGKSSPIGPPQKPPGSSGTTANGLPAPDYKLGDLGGQAAYDRLKRVNTIYPDRPTL